VATPTGISGGRGLVEVVASMIATTGRLPLPQLIPQLNVGRLNNFAPFLGIRFKELGKIGGRTRKHFTSYLGNPRLHFGIGKYNVGLAIERGDNFVWYFLGCGNADRRAGLEARQIFTERRHIRERRPMVRTGDRKRP
jgi:hypothetical protein